MKARHSEGRNRTYARSLLVIASVVVCTGLFLSAQLLQANGGVQSIQIDRDGSSFEFTASPVQTLHMSLPGSADMTVTHGAEGEYTMSGNSEKGIVAFKTKDGRKMDVYAYEPDGRQLKNTITYTAGNGTEEEVYTYENIVLHKNESGVIEGYFLPATDFSRDPKTKNASRALLDRASQSMHAEAVESLFKNGAKNPSFTIPAPWVKDHDGKEIPVDVLVSGPERNQLVISFAASPIQYPLILDPTYALATDMGQSISAGSYWLSGVGGATIGDSLAVGDLNNDGIDDLAVGASTSGYGLGRVHIFYGDGANGYGTQPCTDYTTGAALFTNGSTVVSGTGTTWTIDVLGRLIRNNANGSWYTVSGRNTNTSISISPAYTGATTAYSPYTITGCESKNSNALIAGSSKEYFGTQIGIADMNGDGKDDLLVGTTDYLVNLYIFYNDGSWPASSASADVHITGPGGSFGIQSFATGDVTGDGKPDLVIGRSVSNALYVFHNDGSYPSTVAGADATISGTTQDSLGVALAIGDVNNDGIGDIVAASVLNYGRVYMFYSDGSYPASTSGADVIIGSASTVSANLGTAVALGDLNNDGILDLAVSATAYQTNVGRVFVFYGDGTKNWGTASCADYTTGTAAFSAASTLVAGVGTGWTNAIAGRVIKNNANGIWRTILGSDIPTRLSLSAIPPNMSGAYTISGCSSANADAIITGESASWFGAPLIIDDMNADGRSDLIAGAYRYSSYLGRVYIFNSDGSYPSAASSADTIFTGTVAGGRYGVGITVGDFHHNGSRELAVGAPYVAGMSGVVYAYTGTPSNLAITSVSHSPFSATSTVPLTLSGIATSSRNITTIEIYLDGSAPANLVQTCNVNSLAPAPCTVSAGLLSVGTHTTFVKATDDSHSVTATETFNVALGIQPPIYETFSKPLGTTIFENVPDLTAVQAPQLVKPDGKIVFEGSIYAGNQNYDANIQIGSGFVSMNKAALDPTTDSPAHISLVVPNCVGNTLYYSNGYRASAAAIENAGQVCNASTTPACTNIVCANGVISFDVPHFDSFAVITPGNFIIRLEVGNAAPVVSNVKICDSDGNGASCPHQSLISPNINSDKAYYVYADVTDANGIDDVTSARLAFYRQSVASGENCIADGNNCYYSLNCTVDEILSATTARYLCPVTINYWIDPTVSTADDYPNEDWVASVTVIDSSNSAVNGTNTAQVDEVLALAGFPTLIDYGSHILGFESDNTNNVTATITQVGNVDADIQIKADAADMVCDGLGTIAVENQKFDAYSSTIPGFAEATKTLSQIYTSIGLYDGSSSDGAIRRRVTDSGYSAAGHASFNIRIPSGGVKGVCTSYSTVTTVKHSVAGNGG